MGLEMDFDKKCRVGLSPNTVLPTHRHSYVEKRTVITTHRHSYVEKRSSKGKSNRKDDLLSIKEDFAEISFHCYRSNSCKTVPSRPVAQEVNLDLKRGSIYQSSKEVRNIKKLGTVDGRRKVEMPRSNDSAFSYRIVDTMCSSDEENSQNRPSVISLKSELDTPSVGRPNVEPCSSDSLIDLCLDPDNREKHSAEALGEDSVDLKLRSDLVAGPLNDGNELERDRVHTLHKSFSSKVEMLHSPSPAESARSSMVSSKVRFSPIRKMFHPFMKSKSLRSPSYVVEPGRGTTTATKNLTRNRTHQKSLLPVFSKAAESPDCDPQFINRDNHQSLAACSPVHLHGHLMLQNKHGMPFFEFSLKCSEDVYVARTWKADVNSVYTFHSIGNRKKSNASGWRLQGSDRDSSMVGQMQVSCYLCSELKDGVFDNSMVTEFVLYDIAHARQTFAAEENSNCTPDDVKPTEGSNPDTVGATVKLDGSCPPNVKLQQKHASDNSGFDSSAWASADLHPNLEISAIVMQVPLEKRESLEYKRGDKILEKANPLNLPTGEQKKGVPDSQSPGNVKVVIPTGNHGLPSAESRGPSSLLNRWRLGGGCECGGWDMSCPLIVLSNPHPQCAGNQLFEENQQPLELFVQGSKEELPALTMTLVEEGQYAVDFHAQLSTLQAFSVCVAILHGTETSAAARQERNKQLSQCNSLKVLIEEEVNHLIEAVTAGEKKHVAKRVKKIQPSYMLNPPFSPIGPV